MGRLEDTVLTPTPSQTDSELSSLHSLPALEPVGEARLSPPPSTPGQDGILPQMSPELPSPPSSVEGVHGESPTPEPAGSYGNVLQNKNFLVLWSGQVFSQVADKVFLVLLVALVSSHYRLESDSISRWVAAIMVAFTIPAVLFGSVAGVYVDRWSKKWVMVGTNLVRGGLVLAVPLLLWAIDFDLRAWGCPLDFLALLGITFGVSTLTQFFAPAEQSAIPLIVKKQNLLPANSLYTATMMASVIVGFAIGEPLLAAANRVSLWLNWGPELGSEVAVGGGYAIAGVLLLTMTTGEHHRSPSPQHSNHVWQDIREGLQYLGRSVRVRAAIGQMVVLFSIFAALAVLAVRLAELIPALNAAQFGVLLAAAGVGMGLGALIVGQFGNRCPRRLWSAIGALGITASLVVLATMERGLWSSLAGIACLGCAGALVGVPMQTLIQEETPPDMRGKVFGLQNNLVNIALSLPLALASIAETRFGLSPVLLALAGASTLSGLVGWQMMSSGSPEADAAECLRD